MAVKHMRIMIRRDTAIMWEQNGDNVLLPGEMGYETDARKLKIGDGNTAYRDLPYFADGITGGGDGITIDEDGNITLDTVTTRAVSLVNAEGQNQFVQRVIAHGFEVDTSDLHTQEDANLLNVDLLKELKDELTTETSNRTSADSSLQQQIVTTNGQIGNVVSDLQTEKEERMAADQALQQQITSNDSDVSSLVTDLQQERDARLAGDQSLQLQINSNSGNITDIEDKFGPLSISGPTGGTFAADNVTDFVSDLLFKNATGDMGGHSMKVYVDNGTQSITDELRLIYDNGTHVNPPVSPTGIVVDLGEQINDLKVRVTNVENKVGALENKFDQNGDLNANIIGDLTGNTNGNHTGDVLDADGNVIVDVANANFNGNVTGNLTGDTVGTHYGSVETSTTGSTPGKVIIDGDTGVVRPETLVVEGGANFKGNVTAISATTSAESSVATFDDLNDSTRVMTAFMNTFGINSYADKAAAAAAGLTAGHLYFNEAAGTAGKLMTYIP